MEYRERERGKDTNKRNLMSHEDELSYKDYLRLLNEMEKAALEVGYYE